MYVFCVCFCRCSGPFLDSIAPPNAACTSFFMHVCFCSWVLDLDDLEKKAATSKAKVLLVSHMRSKVSPFLFFSSTAAAAAAVATVSFCVCEALGVGSRDT